MNEKLIFADLLVELKNKAERYNASSLSITITQMKALGGWDAKVTVAAPGVIDKDENDDE